VLETGRITLHGPGKQLLADDAVRKAYLGDGHGAAASAGR
jgi:branched-chain amino acid transport system ATP-binding protein